MALGEPLRVQTEGPDGEDILVAAVGDGAGRVEDARNVLRGGSDSAITSLKVQNGSQPYLLGPLAIGQLAAHEELDAALHRSLLGQECEPQCLLNLFPRRSEPGRASRRRAG